MKTITERYAEYMNKSWKRKNATNNCAELSPRAKTLTRTKCCFTTLGCMKDMLVMYRSIDCIPADTSVLRIMPFLLIKCWKKTFFRHDNPTTMNTMARSIRHLLRVRHNFSCEVILTISINPADDRKENAAMHDIRKCVSIVQKYKVLTDFTHKIQQNVLYHTKNHTKSNILYHKTSF